MASNVTTNWVDIANAVRAATDEMLPRLTMADELAKREGLNVHPALITDTIAWLVRLRTLLDTVDATHGQPEQRTVTVTLTGGTADDHAAAKAVIDDLVGQPRDEPTEADPWRVDEFETHRVDGPNGARVRCYQANGTDPDPALAVRVAAWANERALVGGRSAAPTREQVWQAIANASGPAGDIANLLGDSGVDWAADAVVALLSRSAAEPPEDDEAVYNDVKTELGIALGWGDDSDPDDVRDWRHDLVTRVIALTRPRGVAAEPNEGRAVMRGLSIYDEDTGEQLAGPEIDAEPNEEHDDGIDHQLNAEAYEHWRSQQ